MQLLTYKDRSSTRNFTVPVSVAVSVVRYLDILCFKFISPNDTLAGRLLTDHRSKVRRHPVFLAEADRFCEKEMFLRQFVLDKDSYLLNIQDLTQPFDQTVQQRVESGCRG